MKPVLKAALIFALCSSAALAEVTVSDAYVRGLPPGVSNTSAYMTLQNNSDDDMVLTGASSPIAETVMLHSTMSHNGMMHMQHVDQAEIPAGGKLALISGSMHLMLTGLRHNPAAGEVVEITLEFADGSTQRISAPVRSVLDE